MPATFENRWYQDKTDVYARIRESGISRESPPSLHNSEVKSSSTDSKQRSVQLLLESLRDAGMDDIDGRDFSETSDQVIALVWKLLSERQRDLRQFSFEKERHAKIESDNKMLKAKLSRLTDDISKLRTELSDLRTQHKKREEDFFHQLQTTQRNRKYVLRFHVCTVNIVSGRSVRCHIKVVRRSIWRKLRSKRTRTTSYKTLLGAILEYNDFSCFVFLVFNAGSPDNVYRARS